MKILMIEPSGKRGLSQYAHNLSNALAKRNHEVLLATSINFETKNLPRSYQVIEVFDRFLPRPFRIIHLFLCIKKYKPDVINIQGAIHPLLYFVLWKILKIVTSANFIYTSHEIFPKKKAFFSLHTLKFIYHGMSHIIVHARQNKESLIQHFKVEPGKVSVLPMGNLTAFAENITQEKNVDIPSDKKVLLYFGIIEPQKGLMTLIRAFSEIRKKQNNVLLFIAGQPFEDMAPYLQEMKRLNLEDSIKLKLGYVPIEEVPGILKTAHVVILPYDNASQSGVLLSAYSCGKPVVATSVGGLTELVSDGNTGFLVPPGSPKELAEAALKLLNNDSLREEMGNKAMAMARKNHSWSAIAQKAESIYELFL